MKSLFNCFDQDSEKMIGPYIAKLHENYWLLQ